MSHQSNAAVVVGNPVNLAELKEIIEAGVQYVRAEKAAEKPAIPRTLAQVLDSGLVPYEEAAAALGIEPKRLLGLMLRQRVDDPIGGQAEDGTIYVYGWSLKALAARAAVTDTASTSTPAPEGQP